ncbi:uncharacterized protein LOC126843304 [Adelges cooleyi]|uniref:uncharacterized protein LOC126843304 n=1 Tax=Adelges cooleyi TaxID=133065 RepID=UPI00217F9262|nr:uncharacterized protein LOC126843304 [Adelges cooleyi]
MHRIKNTMMNLKNCFMFLYLLVHLYTANAGICENPTLLAKIYKGCLEDGKGVYTDTVRDYLKKPNVLNEFKISNSDAKKIRDSVWDTKMSQEEFIASVTAKFTLEQLVYIYIRVYRMVEVKKSISGVLTQYVYEKNKVNKRRVKKYLLKKQRRYRLKKEDIENITAPLKVDDMSWEEFLRFMVLKK